MKTYKYILLVSCSLPSTTSLRVRELLKYICRSIRIQCFKFEAAKHTQIQNKTLQPSQNFVNLFTFFEVASKLYEGYKVLPSIPRLCHPQQAPSFLLTSQTLRDNLMYIYGTLKVYEVVGRRPQGIHGYICNERTKLQDLYVNQIPPTTKTYPQQRTIQLLCAIQLA